MLNNLVFWLRIIAILIVVFFVIRAIYKKMHADVTRNNQKFNDEINRYKRGKK